MIKDRIIEAQLLATLALGSVIAAPYVLCLLIKEELSARL